MKPTRSTARNNELDRVMRDQSSDPCGVKVVAYITSWCPDCTRSRRVLQRLGWVFAEIDTEKIPGAEEAMRAINGGSGKVPTILTDGPGGRSVLVEPGDRELADELRRCSRGEAEAD